MSSKNNVNPDHYKLAGRDRRDDKMAEGLGRAREYARKGKGREKGPDFRPGQGTAARKRSAGAKSTESAKSAESTKEKRGGANGTKTAKSAKQKGGKAAGTKSMPAAADRAGLDLGRAVDRNATAGRRSRAARPSDQDQSAPEKRGQGSSAVERATSRHGTNPSPASKPVAGAYGKQGGLSEVEESIVDMEPRDNPEEGDDFLAVRRKQNKRARK